MTDEKTEKRVDAVPVYATTPPPPRGSSTGGIFVGLLFVAVAGIGYFGWQQRQNVASLQQQYDSLAQANSGVDEQADSIANAQQQLQQSVASLQAALEQLQASQQQVLAAQQQQQTSVQQQLQTISTTVGNQTAQLANLEREVGTLGNRLAETGDAVIRDQVLAEVEGILRLAEQRLQVARDVTTAQSLLRTSDELLSRVAEPEVAALRTQVQGDIAALQAVMPVDVLVLHEQIGTLIVQLDGLHAVSATAQNDLSVPSTEAEPETGAEPGWFDETVDFLGKYFVITQRDAPITPLLSPEQDWLIRKNIALKLEQARVAALARDTTLFRSMLVDAQAGIEMGLDGEGKVALLAALADLAGIELQTALPSLANTLAAVQLQQGRLPVAAPATEVVQ